MRKKKKEFCPCLSVVSGLNLWRWWSQNDAFVLCTDFSTAAAAAEENYYELWSADDS
jgi:hypothetical protein